jgi:hypothetical protein
MEPQPQSAEQGRRFGPEEVATALQMRYGLLFESASDAVFLEDTEGRIVAAHPPPSASPASAPRSWQAAPSTISSRTSGGIGAGPSTT